MVNRSSDLRVSLFNLEGATFFLLKKKEGKENFGSGFAAGEVSRVPSKSGKSGKTSEAL